MRRIIFYLLFPALIIFGLLYFFFFVEPKSQTIKGYIAKQDKVVAHIPHVFEALPQFLENSIFQHISHLQGLDQMYELIAENKSLLSQQGHASLTIVLKKSNHFLLILNEDQGVSSSSKLLESLEMKDDYYAQTVSGTVWYFNRFNHILLASTDPNALEGDESDPWLIDDANWIQPFISFNPKMNLNSTLLKSLVSDLTQYFTYSLHVSDFKINLSGYAPDSLSTLPSLIGHQQPVDFESEKVIINDAITVSTIQFGDEAEFLKVHPELSFPEGSFTDFSLTDLGFNLPSKGFGNVWVAKSKNLEGLKTQLGEATASKSHGFQVHRFKQKYSFTDAFGQHFKGQLPKLGVCTQEVLVMANTQDEINFYLDRYLKNDIWAFSLEKMKWVEQELIPSNYLQVYEVSHLKNLFKDHPNVQQYLDDNQSVIDKIPRLILQQSTETQGEFSVVSFNLRDNDLSREDAELPTTVEHIPLDGKVIFTYSNPIQSKAFPVKNHADQSMQFIVIDRMNHISLTSESGQQIWGFELEGKLKSKIFEIDVFKNNKIQYIFATDKKLYCVDRLGRMVENFPIVLPDNRMIESFNLIDYDHSRNYRLALTSKNEVWLYGTDAKPLEGWNPLKFESRVIGSLNHVRIQSKDHMIVAEQSGQINILQRKGVPYPEFKIQLGGVPVANAFYANKKDELAQSNISFLNQKGEVHKFSFRGGSLSQEKLLGSGSYDSLFVQAIGSRYRYFTLQNGLIQVFDDYLVRKFTSDQFIGVTNIQAYDLGNVDVYAIFHKNGMTLIDQSNKVIFENLPTQQEITLYYSSSQKKGYFYFSVGKELKKNVFEF